MGQGWTRELTQLTLGAGCSSFSCTWGACCGACGEPLAVQFSWGKKREDLGVSAAGRRQEGSTAMSLSPRMPVLSLPHACT